MSKVYLHHQQSKLIVKAIIIFGVIFLMLISTQSFAQEARVPKSDRVFLSTAYYDIFQKNISNEALEHLVAFVYTFGDKAMAKDMILRKWLFENADAEPKEGIDDEKDEIRALLEMMPFTLEGSNIEKVCKPVVFTFMHALLEAQGSFFENEAFLSSRLKEVIPGILEADIFEDRGQMLDFLAQHPDEFARAVALFDHFFQASQRQSADEFFNQTRQAVREKYPLIDLFLSLDVINKTAPTAHKLSEREGLLSGGEEVIRDVYTRLLYREPTASEVNLWESLVRSENRLGLEMIYYLIMSGEEYQYH